MSALRPVGLRSLFGDLVPHLTAALGRGGGGLPSGYRSCFACRAKRRKCLGVGIPPTSEGPSLWAGEAVRHNLLFRVPLGEEVPPHSAGICLRSHTGLLLLLPLPHSLGAQPYPITCTQTPHLRVFLGTFSDNDTHGFSQTSVNSRPIYLNLSLSPLEFLSGSLPETELWILPHPQA